MQIKTTMRYHLTPVRWLSSKRPQITNVGEDVEKGEPLYTVGGNVNWCIYCENIMEFPQKTKKELSSSNSTPGYISKENETTNYKIYMYPSVHSSIIYSSQCLKAT